MKASGGFTGGVYTSSVVTQMGAASQDWDGQEERKTWEAVGPCAAVNAVS